MSPRSRAARLWPGPVPAVGVTWALGADALGGAYMRGEIGQAVLATREIHCGRVPQDV